MVRFGAQTICTKPPNGLLKRSSHTSRDTNRAASWSRLLAAVPSCECCSGRSPAVIDAGDISTGQNFSTHTYAGPYDLIITNPPYSLALCAPHGAVVMLLRVNWLGGQERAPWMRLHTPSLYVSPRRPSFTGAGSAATEYAWMTWDSGAPRVVILNTEGDSRSGQLFA